MRFSFISSEAREKAFIFAVLSVIYKLIVLSVCHEAIFRFFDPTWYFLLYSTSVLTLFASLSRDDTLCKILCTLVSVMLILCMIGDGLFYLIKCGNAGLVSMLSQGIHPLVTIGLYAVTKSMQKEIRQNEKTEDFYDQQLRLYQQQQMYNGPQYQDPAMFDGPEYGTTEADKAYERKYNTNITGIGDTYK